MPTTFSDVRRIVRSLPGAVASGDGFAFSVRRGDKDKGFAWVWRERVDPRKPRVPNPKVLAVRVADLTEKDSLIGLDRAKFFTEPHYAGFPAVLVRLPAVGAGELEALVTSAWRCVAPRAPGEARASGGKGRARKAQAPGRRPRRPAGG